MPTVYSRVTVINGTRRVDLAVPATLPLFDVLPQLLRFCAPHSDPERPASWTLGRLGGADLPLTGTLADADVVDGEVLELRTDGSTRPAQVADVRDLLEDTVDRSAWRWQPRTTVAFGLVAAAAALAGALALPGALPSKAPGSLAVTVVVAAGLVGAGWWAARAGHSVPAQVALGAAALWGGATGWSSAALLSAPLPVGVGAAAAGAFLVTALARAVHEAATPHLAALAPIAAAGGVAATAELLGLDPLTGPRVAAVTAVLLVGVLPRASLTVGGLASADYLVRQHGQMSQSELTDRIRRSSALLHGAIWGTAGMVVTAAVLLALSDAPWDLVLGAVVGVALLLRSRVFSQVPHVAPVRAAGLLVLAATLMGWVVQEPAARPWAVPLVAAAATLGISASAVRLSEVARARVKQLLNRAEAVVVAGMVLVAAAALGVFTWLAGFVP